MSKRQISRAAVAAITLAITAVTAPAADLYWQGGATGSITDSNYYKPSTGDTNLPPPTSGDFEYVGGDGTVTLGDGQTVTLARLRIGHNFTAGGSTGPAGPGTFTVTGGSLTLAGTTVGSTSADTEGSAGGLILGYNESATMNISAGTVTVGRYISVGLDNANDAISNADGATATLNISGTGTVAVTHATNAASTVYVGNGVPGSITISDSGTLKATSKSVDLQIGSLSPATFTQTGGTTSFTGAISVGLGTVTGASMNVSGGTVASGTINVGNDNALNSSITISGNAQVTGSGGFNIGSNTAANSSATIKDNAVVNLKNGMTVGLGTDPNAVLNVGDNAQITLANSGNSDVHFFIGRGSSTTTFNMTGGSILAPNYVLIGTATSSAATITINHSAGTITAGTNLTPAGPTPITVRVGFKVGDTAGTSTYNLSGTGAINVANGLMIVGRQGSVATFNQTGGTVTASGGLHVGEAETATATLQTATGTYVISGGTINASVPTGSTVAALAVGNADTGTLRIVGGDAAINVTGNVLVNTGAAADPTPARVGTLAYQLQAGESLTKINATGTATFSAASVLSLDLNGVASPASSYDILTAAAVVNNGLALSAPAGWHVDLVDGGTAKTLRFVNAINGDANQNGKIDADDYALIDRGYAQQAQWWHNGDFNDNGVIDSQDYLLIDTALGQQNGGHFSPDFLAFRESQFGSGYVADLVAAVPEPGTLSVLAAGVLPLLGRRRRSR